MHQEAKLVSGLAGKVAIVTGGSGATGEAARLPIAIDAGRVLVWRRTAP